MHVKRLLLSNLSYLDLFLYKTQHRIVLGWLVACLLGKLVLWRINAFRHIFRRIKFQTIQFSMSRVFIYKVKCLNSSVKCQNSSVECQNKSISNNSVYTVQCQK